MHGDLLSFPILVLMVQSVGLLLTRWVIPHGQSILLLYSVVGTVGEPAGALCVFFVNIQGLLFFGLRMVMFFTPRQTPLCAQSGSLHLLHLLLLQYWINLRKVCKRLCFVEIFAVSDAVLSGEELHRTVSAHLVSSHRQGPFANSLSLASLKGSPIITRLVIISWSVLVVAA